MTVGSGAGFCLGDAAPTAQLTGLWPRPDRLQQKACEIKLTGKPQHVREGSGWEGGDAAPGVQGVPQIGLVKLLANEVLPRLRVTRDGDNTSGRVRGLGRHAGQVVSPPPGIPPSSLLPEVG